MSLITGPPVYIFPSHCYLTTTYDKVYHPVIDFLSLHKDVILGVCNSVKITGYHFGPEPVKFDINFYRGDKDILEFHYFRSNINIVNMYYHELYCYLGEKGLVSGYISHLQPNYETEDIKVIITEQDYKNSLTYVMDMVDSMYVDVTIEGLKSLAMCNPPMHHYILPYEEKLCDIIDDCHNDTVNVLLATIVSNMRLESNLNMPILAVKLVKTKNDIPACTRRINNLLT